MTSGMIVATTLGVGSVMTLLTWGFGVAISDKKAGDALESSLSWGSVSAGLWAVGATVFALFLG